MFSNKSHYLFWFITIPTISTVCVVCCEYLGILALLCWVFFQIFLRWRDNSCWVMDALGRIGRGARAGADCANSTDRMPKWWWVVGMLLHKHKVLTYICQSLALGENTCTAFTTGGGRPWKCTDAALDIELTLLVIHHQHCIFRERK